MKKGKKSKRKEELKALLIEKKRHILADVKKSMGKILDEDVRLTFEVLKDNADKSVDELIKHVDAKIMGNKSELLDEIDEALNKLEEETYGICEECGVQIPVARLRAVPFAALCVRCQNEMDKKKKRRGYLEEQTSIPDDGDTYRAEE